MISRKRIFIYLGAALLLLFFISLHLDKERAVADSPAHASVTEERSGGIKTSTITASGVNLMRFDAVDAVLEFVDSVPPSQEDRNVYMVLPGAFTGQRLEKFNPFNVCGQYVTGGVLKKGFPSKYCTGYCLAYGDSVVISGGDIRKPIALAVKHKGYFFQQLLLVGNSKAVDAIPFNKVTLYRALCIMQDGSLSVLQSASFMTCTKFAEALVEVGVRNALYLDMGKWAWGWARDLSGNVSELSFRFEEAEFQTNWVVLRNRSEK